MKKPSLGVGKWNEQGDIYMGYLVVLVVLLIVVSAIQLIVVLVIHLIVVFISNLSVLRAPKL